MNTIKKSTIDHILTNEEKSALAQIADNPAMKSALKKAILTALYHNGTLQKGQEPDMLMNFALGAVAKDSSISDEEVGRNLRATWQGIQLLEVGLGIIANYQTIEKIKVEDKKIGR